MNKILIILSLVLLGGSFVNHLTAEERIGVAAAVKNNTIDLTLNEERNLVNAGYKIIQNHTLETDNMGKAHMLLLDGTSFSLGPNSSLVLDKFIYNPETADGTLEVTAKGVLRIVGGKLTKKTPAIIKTNSATVGIRGGISIVESNANRTTAAFVYGTQMTVTPALNPDGAIQLMQPGFIVSVENPLDNIAAPILMSQDFVEGFQERFSAISQDIEIGENTSSQDSNSSISLTEENDENNDTSSVTDGNGSGINANNSTETSDQTSSATNSNISTVSTSSSSEDEGSSSNITPDDFDENGALDSESSSTFSTSNTGDNGESGQA